MKRNSVELLSTVAGNVPEAVKFSAAVIADRLKTMNAGRITSRAAFERLRVHVDTGECVELVVYVEPPTR